MQVLVPYLKVKVERLYSILTVENDSSRITWSRGQSVKRLLKFIMFKAVPYLQSLWIVSEIISGKIEHILHRLCRRHFSYFDYVI